MSLTHLQIQIHGVYPQTLPNTERAKVADFYAARDSTMPTLPWPSIAPPFTTKLTTIRGHDVLLETPAEIVAKKVVFRGKRLQPRDLFDIAAVAHATGGEGVAAALAPFKDECRAALHVSENMDPRFAKTIMSKLQIHAGFQGLEDEAQEVSCGVLKRALEQGYTENP
jgi:hypothetical protein